MKIKNLIKYLLLISITINSNNIFSINKNYKYKWELENVTVYSDISLEFSKEHANHALLTWKYFSRIFKKSPGNRIELFYTKSEALFNEELTKYPTTVIAGARKLTCFWDRDHRKWFIIPYKTPDFETQLHEISHDFLYFTFPKSEEYPWFKEGSGMYYESGKFNNAGELIITSPHKEYYKLFQQIKNRNELIPLKILLNMKKEIFYRTDFKKTYSQSLMFFYYLMKKHKNIMDNLFIMINNGKINSNELLIKYLLSNTNESLTEMDKKYRKAILF